MLDPNDVNWIQFPDVVLFLKRGSDGERAIRRAQKAKEKRERTLAARAANAFIEWAPTRTYRAALEERGVALPGADTLMALAKQINDALEEKRKDEKNKNAVQEKTSGQPTTFKIFKEMDEDRSGFLSFDEFQWALRQKLWLSKSKLSDDMLMAIWCILDWGTRLAATSIFVLGRDTATNPSRSPTREPIILLTHREPACAVRAHIVCLLPTFLPTFCRRRQQPRLLRGPRQVSGRRWAAARRAVPARRARFSRGGAGGAEG